MRHFNQKRLSPKKDSGLKRTTVPATPVRSKGASGSAHPLPEVCAQPGDCASRHEAGEHLLLGLRVQSEGSPNPNGSGALAAETSRGGPRRSDLGYVSS